MQPLAAQFVLLKIDTGARPVWQAWQSRYEYEGDGIPIIYVIRADGEKLYGRSGVPKKLQEFLKNRLRNAGTILQPAQLAQLQKNLQAARRALKRGDVGTAAELVAESSGSGSYAAAALAMDELAADLKERGTNAVSEAEAKLQSDKTALAGARQLLELGRRYENVPEVKQEVDQSVQEHKSQDKLKDVFAQAERLQQADKLESERKWNEALALYRKLAGQYPDSPAAEEFQEKIAKLEKRIEKRDVARKKNAEEPPDKKQKKAAVYLQLGKNLIQKRPEKAPKYLKKVIELAPESTYAEEARQLLEKLD